MPNVLSENSTPKKLLKNDEIAPMYFEPKVNHRFYVTINDENGKEIIPSFIIRSTTVPNLYYTWYGRRKYEPLTIQVYNPIVPSATACIYKALTNKAKWNITIDILGPVGDKIEEWTIADAKVKSVKFSDLSWQNSGDSSFAEITFKISDVSVVT